MRAKSSDAIILADLDIRARLELTAGWAPPTHASERAAATWVTWREYLAAWVAVADELEAAEGDRWTREPFAAAALRYRDTYGEAALQAVDYATISASRRERNPNDTAA